MFSARATVVDGFARRLLHATKCKDATERELRNRVRVYCQSDELFERCAGSNLSKRNPEFFEINRFV